MANKITMKNIFLIIGLVCCIGCNTSKEKKEDVAIEATERIYPKLDPNRYNVGFLIMDGVFNSELTAPYDIFHHTIFRDDIKPMNVFTVANSKEPVTSFEGLKILPDFDYLTDDLPKIDILVVPSAEHHLDSDLEDTAMLNFVKTTAKNA